MECKIKDLSINYEIIGEGKPMIILHGYSIDHRAMTGCMELASEVSKGFKRIYVDLPGMGKSDCSDWISNADVMLDIVIEFIDRVIPKEDFLIVGYSYGGYLARGIVYKMPERVDGLLLICPVIIADSKKREVPEHVILVEDGQLLSTLSTEEAEEFSMLSVVQSEKIYKRYKNEIECSFELANDEFLTRFQQNGYEFTFDVDDLEETFDKPSLIVVGKQDSCVGYKDAWTILDNYPRTTFTVIDRAGHNLQIEQEELFSSLVNEWTRRVR